MAGGAFIPSKVISKEALSRIPSGFEPISGWQWPWLKGRSSLSIKLYHVEACHLRKAAIVPYCSCSSTKQGGTMLAPAFTYANALSIRLLRKAHPLCRHRRPQPHRIPRASIASYPSKQEASSAKETERRKRVLSGVQPTGALHLGNYLGAMRQWTANQDLYDNFFFVVDLHAVTTPHDRKTLSDTTLSSAAMYIAAGIDPKKSRIFVQSHVRAHAELTWLLNCSTPMGWVERMIQYKEKARRQGENVSVGLFDYPVLMAADVLLYQADLVPVGEDQRQHIELARNIARRYNDIYCKKKRPRTFREPKALMRTTGARVMSLEDGTSKMSKSDENDASRINLTDPPNVIRKKIKRCKTDSQEGLQFDDPQRPECNNLLAIYQIMANKTKEEVQRECGDMRWGQFKPLLADAVAEHISPIQDKYNELLQDKSYLASRDMGFLLPSDLGY
ncbi:unnamed protein product [Chondrus crispus]|uniref:tryptophan--tRNA ligase n=1 Tax=Chondrus crispus TaxID=2769 RepID=R7Q7W2_CHOCR|nr:unnamed protein product [Chondrus crispus]CDF33545.1 unnamed protein product [Chondrus crispus]|eukprot:XP_005713348.1 unnamed protein product [Chondrus crispus]